MLEELLVRHCAPTLAGIKTGSLFSCAVTCPEALLEELRCLNRCLSPKDLRLLPLRIRENRALLYLYRRARLKEDLSRTGAGTILKHCGYACATPERCITRLRSRLQGGEDFPHEIGLFLGYPPEDVWGFIQNGGECYKCIGCWKVYGDEEKALRTFTQYRLCTQVYLRRLKWGDTIEQLSAAEQLVC